MSNQWSSSSINDQALCLTPGSKKFTALPLNINAPITNRIGALPAAKPFGNGARWLMSGSKEIRAIYAATVWPFEICRQSVIQPASLQSMKVSACHATMGHFNHFQAQNEFVMTKQRTGQDMERAIRDLARLEAKLREADRRKRKRKRLASDSETPISSACAYPVNQDTNIQPSSGISGGFACPQVSSDVTAEPDRSQIEIELSPTTPIFHKINGRHQAYLKSISNCNIKSSRLN